MNAPEAPSSTGSSAPLFTTWLWWLLGIAAAGVLGVAVYGVAVDGWAVVAVGLLVAAGAFLAGGLIGFLFGIPRSVATDGSADATGLGRYRSNTNLEQISDWLTKILVGLGLVEIRAVVDQGTQLIDFLAPALGDNASSPGFAFAVLLLFSVSGFLIVYLATRVYLPRAFADADVVSLVNERIEVVQQQRDAQEQADVTALSLVSRRLESDADGAEITQEELNAAVKDASVLTRTQIFTRARDQRRRSERSPKPNPKVVERTIPVFRALVHADTENRFHANHAQIAYALMQQSTPDWAGAEIELTTAIAIRDRIGDRGYLVYELNRAQCRIRLDANFAKHEPAPPPVRDSILADLRSAGRSKSLRSSVTGRSPYVEWMQANEIDPKTVVQDPEPAT